MRNFCHSCKFCTLTISVINADPSIDNRFWSTCQKRFDYVSKKSRKRVNRTTSLIIRLEYVLKMSWRCLEDIFAGRLENFLNTSWKHLRKASWRCLDVLKTFLQDVLKTSWRRLEDVWPGRIYWSWSRRLEDVLKTFSEDAWVRRIYSPWSGRLEDVLKASSEDEDKRRLQDVFIKTNVCRDWRQYIILFTLNFFISLLSQG